MPVIHTTQGIGMGEILDTTVKLGLCIFLLCSAFIYEKEYSIWFFILFDLIFQQKITKTFFTLEKKQKRKNNSTALNKDQSRFRFEAFHFVFRWEN